MCDIEYFMIVFGQNNSITFTIAITTFVAATLVTLKMVRVKAVEDGGSKSLGCP